MDKEKKIFFIDVTLQKTAVYLMGAYLRLLKSKGFKHVDEVRSFWENPWDFRYLYVNPTTKEYYFISDTPKDIFPIYHLDINWVEATEF